VDCRTPGSAPLIVRQEAAAVSRNLAGLLTVGRFATEKGNADQADGGRSVRIELLARQDPRQSASIPDDSWGGFKTSDRGGRV